MLTLFIGGASSGMMLISPWTWMLGKSRICLRKPRTSSTGMPPFCGSRPIFT